MATSPLPVSFASNTITSVPIRYQVLSQNGRQVVVQNDACWLLSLGQTLLFNTGVTGVVVLLEGTLAQVLLAEEVESALYATADDWLRFDPPSTKLYDDPTMLGSLKVYCSNTATSRSGFLGWSFFANNRIVAKGNDLSELHLCEFEGQGEWSPGDYRLEVRSFLPNPLQPLRYARKQWELTEPVSKLSMGALDDFEPKLRLD